MNIRYQTYGPHERVSDEVILPQQTHSANIAEVITGNEDVYNTDGVWSKKNAGLILGIKTADCAPIVFWDKDKYGVIHCGWRGLVDGVLENMLEVVDKSSLQVWGGPMFPVFEIQKDECYKRVEQKFGSSFFMETEGKIYFQFQDAIKSLLPWAKFDSRSTFGDVELASWRRDRDGRRNVTVVTEL